MILESADHLQPRSIAHMGETRIFMSAEISLQDPAVLGAIENGAPCFQFTHSSGRFARVQLGHAPIVHILTAAHGISEMDFPIVPIVYVGEGGGNAAFCHDGMRLAEKRF